MSSILSQLLLLLLYSVFRYNLQHLFYKYFLDIYIHTSAHLCIYRYRYIFMGIYMYVHAYTRIYNTYTYIQTVLSVQSVKLPDLNLLLSLIFYFIYLIAAIARCYNLFIHTRTYIGVCLYWCNWYCQ